MSHDYVTAEDLYLSIVSDGRMYAECCDAARITEPAKREGAFDRITDKGWNNYKRDVGPSLIKTEALEKAARLLENDRVAHVAELAAGRWQFCGFGKRGDIMRPIWRYGDGAKWVYQVGDAAKPCDPPAGGGGYYDLPGLLKLRGLELVEPFSGKTHRTACQRGRVTYSPEWDRAKPWASYLDGTAGQHFADLDEAAQYFAARGLSLNIGA